MNNRSFNEEYDGQALSLDLMLGFVLLTVIIGISADAMDIASYKMQDYSYRTTLDRLAVDAADILVKSPGSPGNWEKYGLDQATIPGLAEIDAQTGRTVPNTVSIAKINKLKENYNYLIYGRILPWGVNSSMIIYPSNNSFAPVSIMNNTPPVNVCDIVIANRTVILDFMHLKVAICNNTHEGNVSAVECANPDHRSDNSSFKTEWKCNYFNLTRDELDSSDFYLITSGNINKDEWVIGKANCQNSTMSQFTSNPTCLNDKIKELMGNNNKTLLWAHILAQGSSNNAYDYYIVTVPKGTSPDMVNINYLDTGPWFFVLSVWR